MARENCPENKNKYLFCDCAEAYAGKTPFLLNVIDYLLNKGYNLLLETNIRSIKDPITYQNDGSDRWVVLEKDGKLIIVQTEGDYRISFSNTYDYLSQNEVDIIICASRLDPKIKERASELSNRYQVYFFQHYISMEGNAPFFDDVSVENFCKIIDKLCQNMK